MADPLEMYGISREQLEKLNLNLDNINFKMPRMAQGIVPLKAQTDHLEKEANRARETRRFIISTIIGMIAAIASIVAAVVGILTYPS